MTISANQAIKVVRSASHPSHGRRRRIVFVVFDGTQLLDLTGPLDVFATANTLARADLYDTTVGSLAGGSVRSASGLSFSTTRLASVRGAIDTLMITGGPGTRAALSSAPLLRSIVRLSSNARRTGSVCSGSFLLAEAGLLDNRRATTHWQWCSLLADRYPAVDVLPDAIFVVDEHVWTSAGVTAGIDLALELVGRDHGADLANQVARQLVVYRKRAGGQSQFSATPEGRGPDSAMLRPVLNWMKENLEADLSICALASSANMSERNFARVFRRETKSTPAAFVEWLRIDQARTLLETTTHPVSTVAKRCGFGTVETMHRVFRRRLGTTPGQHRAHFDTVDTVDYSRAI